MSFHPTAYALAPLLTGSLMLGLAAFAWRRRTRQGGRSLPVLLLGVGFWSLCSGLEILAVDQASKLSITRIAYAGILAVPPAFLAVALRVTGRTQWLRLRVLVALSALPAVVMAFVASDLAQPWVWSEVALDESGPYPDLEMGHGPVFWLSAFYGYAAMGLASAMLARHYWRCWPAQRREACSLVPSALVPWAANALYLSGISPLGHLDPTPYAFAVTGVLLAWGLLHEGIFGMLRVARRALVEELSDGILVVDGKGRLLDANRRARSTLALPRMDEPTAVERALAHHPELLDFLARGEPGHMELCLQSLDGGPRVYDVELGRVAAGRRRDDARLLVLRDVSAYRRAEQQIRALAYYDGLTGLPNRERFRRSLEKALDHARERGDQVALLFLDLDRFKRVNDSLGHRVGDQLLCEVARRFEHSVRTGDLIARRDEDEAPPISRLGGDEFTVMLVNVGHPLDAAVVAQRLLDSLYEPIEVDDYELTVGASIGIAVHPEDGDDAATLLRNADTAMYSAKENGRNRFHFYSASMNAAGARRLEMESELRGAAERGEFALFYQPVRCTTTGRVDAMEALLRWRHPTQGWVEPSEFITVAEETGLVVSIGAWALHEACRQVRIWWEAGYRPLRLAVNVSSQQLGRSRLVSVVDGALLESGLSASLLELEITESSILDDREAAALTLQSLQDRGVAIALDDFGTGYSSLSHLREFPLDRIKIDRSFLVDVSAFALVEGIVSLAHSLGLGVVAEGVETLDQLELARSCGCDEVQGFLVSPALPADQFVRFLERAKPDDAQADDAQVDERGDADADAS